ncbi:MAG: hypothetical protein WCH21_06200 [Bacteroidota bacterium]
MGHNDITPIEGANLTRTGNQQFLTPVEPTHLVKYKGIPKIGPSKPTQTKQTKYKLEPPLLDRDFKPIITQGHLADEYNSFEENQIYVSPEIQEIYKKEGLWDSIVKYNDLLDERAANLVGYDKEMTQAELDYNYSKIVALRNIIMSSSALIDSKYPEGIPNTVDTPDLDISNDDADAIVDYAVNADIDTSMLEGIGTERASAVDPAEVSLFLSSKPEARRQQQMFNQFSMVVPGNGLGSMKSNPLRQHNAMTDAKQYAYTLANAPRYSPSLGHNYNSPVIVPSLESVENKNRGNSAQPYFINTIQNNFGKVDWEEDGYRANQLMSGHFTPERINSSNYRAYDNPYSIEHPELALSRYRFKPTEISELRNDGFSYGLHNVKPSTQGNILYGAKQNGYDFTPLMRDDKYGSKSTVKSSIDINSQRIISSRM